MNYKLFALIALLCSVAFISCSSDDDTYEVDEEWKKYNEQVVLETAANKEYTSRSSLSGNGDVYWKYVDDFVPDKKSGKLPKITEDDTPYFTDSVLVRYTGWYLLKDGTKYTFDTTEGDYNGVPRGFRVGGVVDGFATMLQHMKVGDQVEVCIPQRLGYGATSQRYIPAYTTIWFRIKLLKIIPDNPGEWDK